MQMTRVEIPEIFRNKRTTFGGTPLFGTEITVPFAQNFHSHFLGRLRKFLDQPLRLQLWKLKRKKASFFHLAGKVSGTAKF